MGNRKISSSNRTYYAPNKVHFHWDNSLEPILRIESGDIVNFEFPDVSNYQMGPDANVEIYKRMDFSQLRPIVGPIYVEDAAPGDILEVEVLHLSTRGWGWTVAYAGKGLLGEELEDHYVRVFDLSDGNYVPFSANISVPIRPFLGTMGVAPKESGEYSISPPGVFGGNMDLKSLTKGSKLLLPVQVEGALFSTGDGHAAQGDGEVCLTAVESPLIGALRFNLIKNKKIISPQFITSKKHRTFQDGEVYYGTTGIGPDLLECAKDATRNMIKYLMDEHGLTWKDAYVLCSISMDLRISEIVDLPNYLVSAYLPMSIFHYD